MHVATKKLPRPPAKMLFDGSPSWYILQLKGGSAAFSVKQQRARPSNDMSRIWSKAMH